MSWTTGRAPTSRGNQKKGRKPISSVPKVTRDEASFLTTDIGGEGNEMLAPRRAEDESVLLLRSGGALGQSTHWPATGKLNHTTKRRKT